MEQFHLNKNDCYNNIIMSVTFLRFYGVILISSSFFVHIANRKGNIRVGKNKHNDKSLVNGAYLMQQKALIIFSLQKLC